MGEIGGEGIDGSHLGEHVPFLVDNVGCGVYDRGWRMSCMKRTRLRRYDPSDPMYRVNLMVPGSLYRKMKRLRWVNWSAAATEGIARVLRIHEK